MEPRAIDLLTPREREVLALMAKGLTNGQIAERLDISFATAKTHVSDILSRLGVASRDEAVALWRKERKAIPSKAGFRGAFWIPLVATAAAALAGVAVLAAIVRYFAPGDAVPTELRFPLSALIAGAPVSYELEGLGVDSVGREYPLWLIQQEDGSVSAFVGRDPRTGCIVPYESDYPTDPLGWTVGPDGALQPNSGPSGAFKAYCSGSVFLKDGNVVFGPTSRGLDGFPTRIEGDEAVVDLTRVVLGVCTTDSHPCSAPGQPVMVASLPAAILPPGAAK